MQTTETFIYIVAADSSAPGDYKFINGVALMSEGRDRVAEFEDPAAVAYELKNCLTVYGCAPEIAIVEVTEDDEEITQIV